MPKTLGEAHYASAAFTEGEESSGRDLTFQSGAGTSFELFDSSYYPGLGSAATLNKARAWIAVRQELQFFLAIRLRELALLEWNPRYADGETAAARRRPRDIYDAALRYLDGELGELFRYIQDRETRRNTCIIVTAPYAMEFDSASGRRKERELREPALRVPLILSVPGRRATTRREIVSLENLAGVVAGLAGVPADHSLRGRDFLNATARGESISVWPARGIVSLRTGRWRLTASLEGEGRAANARVREQLGLFDVRGSGRWWERDVSSRNPGAAESLGATVKARLREWKAFRAEAQ